MLQEETPAVADQFGMLLEEAGVEQPFTVAMAEPETDAVAKQCASGCNQQGRPQLQRTQCDQGTDREQRQRGGDERDRRSEEHTSELQSLMRISYAVFCLKKKNKKPNKRHKDKLDTTH